MPEISDERLDEILAAAEKATPVEPRDLMAYEHGGGRLAIIRDGRRDLIADFYGDGADRDFYALCDPTTISTLIAEVKAARAGKGVGSGDDLANQWRDLALQFDGHRIEALSFLRYVSEAANVRETVDRVYEIKSFLGKPPLSGEAVLAKRIAALPALEPQGAQEAVAWEGIQPDGITSDITRKKAKAEMWVHNGWTVRPLYASPTGNSVHGGVSEEAVEAAAWSYDLDAVPRDRDFLIQFDHKEVTIACHSDKWPDGIKPSRALRPARLAEKVVAWQELPAPDTNAEVFYNDDITAAGRAALAEEKR